MDRPSRTDIYLPISWQCRRERHLFCADRARCCCYCGHRRRADRRARDAQLALPGFARARLEAEQLASSRRSSPY